MEYSTLSASFTFWKALLLLPHSCFGLGASWAAWNRKTNALTGFAGIFFIGMVAFVLTHDVIQTLQCRAAAQDNQGEWITGRVGKVTRTYARNGAMTLHFSIDGRPIHSAGFGTANECGFVESFGKAVNVKEGQEASVLLHEGKVIKFTSIQ